VTADDYLAIDATLGTLRSAQWTDGDFTMDGDVSAIDYAAIDANLGRGTVDPLALAQLRAKMIGEHTAAFGDAYVAALTEAQAGRFPVVPEPGGGLLAALGVGAGVMLRRRYGTNRKE
jgi:MYXO-CTERM domain-containing protein